MSCGILKGPCSKPSPPKKVVIRERHKSGKVIPPLRKGIFHKYMTKKDQDKKYTQLTQDARRRVIKRAIKSGEKPLSMFRRLNVLVTLRKNKRDPTSISERRKFLIDRDWVKTTFL
jgi:hypothetical protein